MYQEVYAQAEEHVRQSRLLYDKHQHDSALAELSKGLALLLPLCESDFDQDRQARAQDRVGVLITRGQVRRQER